jgi:hypothetical protein
MMTPDERYAMMAANPPEIDDIFNGTAYFNWAWKGCGFGQLSFEVDRTTQKITCMNECMSRERVRMLLIAFANKIADECVMDCDRDAEIAAEAAANQGDQP